MRKTVAFSIFLASSIWFSCQTETTSDSPLTLIDGKDFSRHVAVLAHDSLEGRMPFSAGEAKTIAYLADEFSKLGLKTGNGDSYFQEVPLVEIESEPTGPLVIKGKRKSLSFTYLDDFVAHSRKLNNQVRLRDSEIVFAGYGIVAPEFGWNDYEDLDVKGKTIAVIANDPGYADSTLFRGRNMTYYGRWTYKFEEAARQGAAGILIIHETGPAGYGWNVVKNSWSGPKLQLQESGTDAPPTDVQGWITKEAAERLFEAAGHSFDLTKEAAKKGFKAVPLGLNASVVLNNTVEKSISHNVLGLIPGTELPEEYIVYMAHWDHLGVGTPVDGDSIYNGAVDNATGVAAILEIAKAFTQSSAKPSRSILFLAVTAEEQGLLGSAYYATHPIYPVKNTLAAINIDAMSPFGRTKDVVIIGKGQSDLDDYVEAAAKKQGRYVRPQANLSTGTYFRSDHFNFAKIGVPALYCTSGDDLWNGGKEAGQAKGAEYGQKRYHSPLDNYSEDWDISGIIEDMQMLYEVGTKLSNAPEFPKWKAGSEFKEIREATEE